MADVVLPAASWGEKDCTTTNSERMVSRSPKMWDAPGEALPGLANPLSVRRRMGFGDSFNYGSGSQVWDEFVRLTKGRPCDMAGITSSRLNDGASLQWPCPDQLHYGTKRRYLDQTFPTPDGKAVFLPRDHRDPFEVTDDDFPFVLTTGRIYAHWHTLTRTGKVEKLMARDPAPYVEMAFEDADRLAVADGDAVRLTTRRGRDRAPGPTGSRHAGGDGVRPVPLGRPVRRRECPELPDRARIRPGREAAGTQVLCGEA